MDSDSDSDDDGVDLAYSNGLVILTVLCDAVPLMIGACLGGVIGLCLGNCLT